MKLTFLVPDIHERPTGGNIYNRRMIVELSRDIHVEVVPWAAASDPQPEFTPAEDDIVILDSLLTQHTDAVRSFRQDSEAVPIILLAHYLHCIDPTANSNRQADAERALLPLFDGAITTSSFAKRALSHAGLPSRLIGVAPPGLDADYREDRKQRDPGDPTELLTVANLLSGKGLLPFIDQLTRLDDVAWQWTLVGDDTLEPDFANNFHTRIRNAGIADRVTTPGAVDPSKLVSRYDNADVFVLPSPFETCSMVTREAMARRLPVVAYDVGGIPGNFGGLEAGTLVDPNEPAALAEAVRRLVTEPNERKRLGETAQNRSRAFPSWPEAADRFLSFLKELE